jgi:hypothetical protein
LGRIIWAGAGATRPYGALTKWGWGTGAGPPIHARPGATIGAGVGPGIMYVGPTGEQGYTKTGSLLTCSRFMFDDECERCRDIERGKEERCVCFTGGALEGVMVDIEMEIYRQEIGGATREGITEQ